VKPEMKVLLAGIELVNPVIAAAGTFGYGIEFEEIVSLERIGGIRHQGHLAEPMTGHAPPRIVQTAAGMLNAIGLQNVGVDEFISRKLPPLLRYPVARSSSTSSATRWASTSRSSQRLNQAEGIAAYELNVLLPQYPRQRMVFGTDPSSLESWSARAKSASHRPLIVKLSPNVDLHRQHGQNRQRRRRDALSLTNTFLAMSIDAETRKPRLSNVTGGLPARPSSPSPCAWSTRPPAQSTFPFSAWAASSPRKMPSNPAGWRHRRPGWHGQLR